MRKRYIPYAAVLLAAAANAQTPVFHEGFDAEQTKEPTALAWYEFINQITNTNGADSWAIDNQEQAEGAGCLKMNNVEPEYSDGEDMAQYDQFWQRGVKFRNLPLQEGKSYRLTWRLKGANTWFNGTEDKKSRMNVALMQGGENADIPLLDAQGNEFKYEVSYFNPDSYEKYVRMFHFASAQLQKDTYAKQHPDKDPLADTFFATFNVFNPGEYFLDEVNLVESPIAGVAYEYYAIRVDFGFPTNIKDLVKNSPLGVVLMPEGCAKVTVNGEEVEVESVELHKNGYMYIYTVDEIEEGADVKIAFNNPEDEACQVKYQGTLAPEGAVPSFEGESADFQETISDEYSYMYFEPSMNSVSPADGSFGLEDVTEVAFTFDRKIDVKSSFQCILNDEEALVLKTTENSETMVFMRKDGKPFDKGLQEVTLSGVVSEVGTEAYATFTSTFEVGKIQLAETEYTSVGSCLFSEAAEGSIPEGWTVYSDGEERASGTTWGTGGRVFSTVAPQGRGIYTRANGGDGTVQSPLVDVPAGDIEIRTFLAYWSSSSDIQVDVCDEAGNVVATKNFTPGVAGEANRNNGGFQFEECPIKFNAAGGKYYVKFTVLTAGFNGMFVGGYDIYTYKQSAGESSDTQIAFEDKSFGGASDNCAPAAGSGWSIWRDGEIREPGADFNYSGSRIFNLGLTNLTSAYYSGTDGAWPNLYIQYGANEGADEPQLYLENGRYQLTYYTANWKEFDANAGRDHIVHFQLSNLLDGTVIVEREDKIENVDMNGDRNAAVKPAMVQFTFKITDDDNYTMKFGGETEQFIGNIKIEKLGSQTAYYLGLVNAARALAEDELKTAASELYDGATKTALEGAIAKYKDPSVLHTPAEVSAATAELEAATKAMETRRNYADRFAAAVDNGFVLVVEVDGTKYAKLDAFTKLKAVVEANIDKEVGDLDDEALIASVTELENNTTYLNNMKADDKGIALLTKQLVALSDLLLANNPQDDVSETVMAAGDALTDDQALAKTLKLQVTKALYDRLAAGENPFELTDDDEEPEEEGVNYKAMDLSSFIQNSDLYVTEKGVNKITDPANVPGWNIDFINGDIMVEWGWVAYTCNDYNPVVNAFLLNGWNGEHDINQTVATLPVGKYRFAVGTQDRGYADVSDAKTQALAEKQHWTVTGTDGTNSSEGEIFSYIWYQVGENEKVIAPFDISDQGQWYGLTEDKTSPFDIPAVDGMTGEVTIGAHPVSYQSSASVDNFRLYMIGKAEGFDYAAAAKKIAHEIETSIEAAGAPEGEPIYVTYYSANGVQVAAPTPNEVTIRVERYANGFVKVVKFRAQ